MKCIVIVFALIASAYAGFLNAPVHAPIITSVPVKTLAPVAIQGVANVPVPGVAPVVNYVQTSVPAGVSHHAYTVPESRFQRTDWETPGALHAIPAIARYAITQPGFTTYIPTSIQKTHISSVPVVTKHLSSVPVVTKSVVQAPVFAAKTLVAAPHFADAGYGLGAY